MIIHEMTRDESLKLLTDKRFGRFACAFNGQPYITPLYFARHEDWLYSFSTEGQKLEWMRLNPLVCVQADDIKAPQDWSSVIVFGRYEELPKHPGYEDARQLAFSLLTQRSAWWQPGYVKTILHGKERKLEHVYFRISISEISGHRAIPSVGESVPFDPPG